MFVTHNYNIRMWKERKKERKKGREWGSRGIEEGFRLLLDCYDFSQLYL